MKASLLTLTTIVACGGGSGGTTHPEPSELVSNKEGGYSVGQPAGWSSALDRGVTRFSRGSGKQTILIRSAPRPAEIVEGKPTSNEDIVEATRKVLQRMTTAKLEQPEHLESPGLEGARFSLTYRPLTVGRTYRRMHIVLLGEKHLFHVTQTAPVDEPLDEQALDGVITTLSEES